MTSLTQFEEFDPIYGYVPPQPFSHLQEIARRARLILQGKTAEQIQTAARKIDSEIETYFSNLKCDAVEELKSRLADDPEEFEAYFMWDGGTMANGWYIFRDEMDAVLDIPTAENSSEVDALKTIFEASDGFRPWNDSSPGPKPEHWPEGKTHELFAVLALKLLFYSIRWAGHTKGSEDLAIAGAFALDAMDAVCFAEHTNEVEWREQIYEKRIFDMSTSLDVQLGEVEDKVRSDLITEQIACERAKRTTHAELMNAVRHQATKDKQQLVCEAWEKTRNDFSSAEKAGNHYADWLEKKSIGYMLKGKQAFYQPRAVTTWIRTYAKEKGIKFR